MTFFRCSLRRYLFMRAQRLRQTPTYGYVWIASFVVSCYRSVRPKPRRERPRHRLSVFLVLAIIYAISPSSRFDATTRNHGSFWSSTSLGGTIIGWGVALVGLAPSTAQD